MRGLVALALLYAFALPVAGPAAAERWLARDTADALACVSRRGCRRRLAA